MPGHGELLAAAHASGFDENNVAAHRRPDQADSDARFLDALFDFFFGAEFRHAEIFTNDLGGDGHLIELAFGDAPGLFTRDGSNLALEVADTGFASEAVNDFANGVVAELQLFP